VNKNRLKSVVGVEIQLKPNKMGTEAGNYAQNHGFMLKIEKNSKFFDFDIHP
jgi:hypothetical protein